MFYTVRFWNVANENIMVGGKYSHDFVTWSDAWEAAKAMLASAHKSGAVEMDINNVFHPIIDD